MASTQVGEIAEVAAADVTSGSAARNAAQDALRRNGVVIVRSAVEPALLADLHTMVTESHSRFLRGEIHNYSLGEETATVVPDIWQDAFTEPRPLQGYRKWNVAGADRRVIPLVDVSPLYDVVYDFVGPDLMVTKSQLIVLPPECLDSPFLHTDAGTMADIVESMDASPVMVSVQLFLTDMPDPAMGNFTCVPGSHRTRFPWSPENVFRSQLGETPLGGDIPPEVRRQVLVKAGDAAVFIHSLWHGVTPNTSNRARKSVILSYSKSFVRPYDYRDTPELVREYGTARQRLLFGDLGGWAWRPGCFYHLPQDHLLALRPDGRA